jgi:hypothetical protein
MVFTPRVQEEEDPVPAIVDKTRAVKGSLRTEGGLPGPSRHHATCAWCREDWHSIVELIDHVEATHLPDPDTTSERHPAA